MNQPNPPEYSSARLWLRDVVERAGSSLVQVLVPIFILVLQSGKVDWKALVTAAFAAVGSVLLAFVPQLVPKGLSYWPDVALRLGKTVVITVVSMLIAAQANLFDPSLWQAAWVLLGTTVLVFVKGEFAKRMTRSTITPASLAPKT